MSKAPEAASDIALVVFMKAPENAKRRLAGELGSLATEAATHLLNCALEDVGGWRGPVWLSPANPEDDAWTVANLAPGSKRITQRGDNLGARLNYVDGELRSRGIQKLIYIGTDCPSLDLPYLERAAACLEEVDAVLGPARDGGVVLMGARRHWPDLRDLGWSTEALSAQLDALCRRQGWTTADLEARTDVDTVADLLAVQPELAADGRRARRALTEWLNAHAAALYRAHGERA